MACLVRGAVLIPRSLSGFELSRRDAPDDLVRLHRFDSLLIELVERLDVGAVPIGEARISFRVREQIQDAVERRRIRVRVDLA